MVSFPTRLVRRGLDLSGRQLPRYQSASWPVSLSMVCVFASFRFIGPRLGRLPFHWSASSPGFISLVRVLAGFHAIGVRIVLGSHFIGLRCARLAILLDCVVPGVGPRLGRLPSISLVCVVPGSHVIGLRCARLPLLFIVVSAFASGASALRYAVAPHPQLMACPVLSCLLTPIHFCIFAFCFSLPSRLCRRSTDC